MTPFRANLKTFYQCRSLYIFNLAVIPLVILSIWDPRTVGGSLGIYLVVAFIAGCLTAWIQKDLLTKPFSYCLPNHRKMPENVVIVAGAFVSFLCALAWTGYAGGQIVLLLFSGMCISVTFFLLGTLFIFMTDRGMQFMGFVIFLSMAARFLGVPVTIESLVVEHPFLNFVLFLLVSSFALLKLREDSFAREHCGKLFMGPGQVFNIEKTLELTKKIQSKKLKYRSSAFAETLQSFVEERMQRSKPLKSGRYIIGKFYETIAPILSNFKVPTMLALWSTMIVIFGYWSSAISKFNMNNILLIMPAVVGLGIQWPMNSTLMLPGGRRERFLAGLAQAVCIVFVATLFAAGVIEFGSILKSLLPPVTLQGQTFVFYPAQRELIFLPLLIMPAMMAVTLFFPKKRMFIPYLIFFTVVFNGMTFWSPPVLALGAINIAGLVVISWLVMISVLRWSSLRKNLI